MYKNDQFEQALVDEINKYGKPMDFAAGDVIMDYGKYIRFMPLVQKGTIKVMHMDEEGREILLYYLSGNDTCSMAYSFSLDAQQSEIKAIAEDEVSLIAISHEKLDEWLCKYKTWKSYILQNFNNRFIELLKTIDTIAFKKLDERLIEYLNEKRKVTGSAVIKASHHAIADDLGTSRVVVSRLLKHLENEGKLLLYRNELKIMKDLH
ncbi:MAG: Crp/Fnr family transcriptional regulator [Chitinophagaceae bacterium]